MTNNINFEIGKLGNTATLLIKPETTSFDYLMDSSKVSERFLHLAALLPKNEILGWQISSDSKRNISSYIFSSSGIKITNADFNWIFQKCGITEKKKRSSKIKNFYGKNRKIYILSSVDGSPIDTGANKNSESNDCNNRSIGVDSFFSEMFNMFINADAVIRFIAGSSDKNASGHGMFLISLPNEISLRMQTIISLVFPHMTAKEIVDSSDINKEENLLPDEYFEDWTKWFLATHIKKVFDDFNREFDDNDIYDFDSDTDYIDDDFDESETDDSNDPYFCYSSMNIWELKLTASSYMSLTNAGINSVRELLHMSDERINHICSTQRQIQEIKKKISEIKTEAEKETASDIDYQTSLNNLVGLSEIKEQIRKIAAFAAMKKEMASNGKTDLSIALNMEFIGNPGTAKTTVARIIAGVFHEIGLLKSPCILEAGRADLIANYEGQTADKVKRLFEKAKGRLLFIDEAYSLIEYEQGAFGDEAINTIVQEMENNREDTIVVFAGYPDKMENFISRNPGLRSRVPFRITFHDYSAEELLRIAEYDAKNRGFSITPEAKEKLTSLCKKAAGNPEYGNGRFCRNLIENAIIEFAARKYGVEEKTIVDRFELEADDFHIPSYVKSVRTTNPIGFVVSR